MVKCNCPHKCTAPLPTLQKKVITLDAEKKYKVDGITDTHNIFRSNHVNTPPLEWDDKLAEYALQYAITSKSKKKPHHPHGLWMEHNPDNKNYGENLAWIRTYQEDWKHPPHEPETDPKDVVAGWYEERHWYHDAVQNKKGLQVKNGQKGGFLDHLTADCIDDDICCQGTRQTGHYTQVISNKSRKIGCAVQMVQYHESEMGGKDGQLVKDELWVCNYDPPGNYTDCLKWDTDTNGDYYCKPENVYFMDEYVSPPNPKKDKWRAPDWMVNQDQLVSASKYF